MSDIYQWRRRIQPGFSRPLIPVGEHDETDFRGATSFGSTRKKVRPKISSYFSHRVSSTGQVKPASLHDNQRISYDESFASSSDPWSEGCEPDPNQIIDSIMRTLLTEPYRPLDVKHNSSLLLIFESYRTLNDENTDLLSKLSQEIDARYTAKHEADLESQRWQQERDEYKAEVKRLEVIIAKGKNGVAGVTHARQGSILRKQHRRRTASGANTSQDEPIETMFEFLERTRAEDEAREEATRQSQTIPNRNRPVSPSRRMTLLSHQFSKTSHYNDLQFESPPSPREFTSLSQASMFEKLAGKSSLSDADSSPEDDLTHTQSARLAASDESSADDNNPSLVHIAAGVDSHKHQPADSYSVDDSSSWVDSAKESNHDTKRRPESLRLRHLDHTRRFSFEYGDDVDPMHPQAQRPAKFQRSASMNHFAPKPNHSPPRKMSGLFAAESITPSSALASPVESPRLSKIPSPVFDPSLAKPRREDSTSSFLTAIRAPDGDANHSRNASRSSNPTESPYQSSGSSFRGSGDCINSQRHSGRYGSMYDVSLAVTAARTAAPLNLPSSDLRGPHSANT